MARNYDLVVIGTGTAATVAATRCQAVGWNIAVVDHRPFGGTCALRGCDPKKVLVGVADAIERPQRLQGRGARAQSLAIDWPELMAFKRSFTDPVPSMKQESYANKGIDAYRGRARFTGRTTVQVEGEALEARHVLIAAGAEPMKLGIPGEEHLATSDEFLELDRLPERVVLVGGGYIAFEFAHVASRAGAEVTILEQGANVLGPFDQDLVGQLVERSRDLGIDVRSGTPVEAVEQGEDGFSVHTSVGGTRETFRADLVVHAAGRAPALDALDLDAAGIDHGHGRIALNEFLQSTSNPAVYAAGDAAQAGPPLTPVSSRDAKVVAANMMEGNHAKPDYRGTPSVVFTIPPLASVGLREHEAREQGFHFRVASEETSAWFTNRRLNENAAGFKALVEERSERILGAHILGPDADELINVFALAVRHQLSADDLKSTSFAYPTSASDIGHML